MLADEDAIRRALHNLVTNALKYGADGRWVGVAARRADGALAGRDEVQIRSSDRGRGIDAEDLPHIFEPFYRGRHALDRQIQGNGLGLSLVNGSPRRTAAASPSQSAPDRDRRSRCNLPVARGHGASADGPSAATRRRGRGQRLMPHLAHRAGASCSSKTSRGWCSR